MQDPCPAQTGAPERRRASYAKSLPAALPMLWGPPRLIAAAPGRLSFMPIPDFGSTVPSQRNFSFLRQQMVFYPPEPKHNYAAAAFSLSYHSFSLDCFFSRKSSAWYAPNGIREQAENMQKAQACMEMPRAADIRARDR